MRYRVLLVDDEALELDVLKNYTDWASMGLEVAGTARNGEEAWRKILEEEPDIVITDIQMPVMDGISLAKRIFELSRQIRIVFLTGYDEVDYLKAAIRVSAADYILKPFSDEAIAAAMKKACDEIERDDLLQYSVEKTRSDLIRKICIAAASERERREWLEKLKRLQDYGQNSDCYGMIQLYGAANRNQALFLDSRLAEIVSVWQEGRKLTAVIRGYVDVRDSAKRIRKLLEELTGNPYHGVYYGRRIGGESLPGAYAVLESYEEPMFFAPEQELLPVSEIWKAERLPEKGEDQEKLLEQLTGLVRAGEEERIREAVRRIFAELEEQRPPRAEILRRMDALLYQIERKCRIERNQESMHRLLKRTEETVAKSLNIRQTEAAVLEYLCAMAAYNAAESAGTAEYVVQKVKAYIHSNYARQINAAMLAEEIHLSPNYMRSVFKEGTGQTILEYLTEYRFEKAGELLREPDAKVKWVSAAVGYDNVPYFCTLFTRIYGISPGEYHKKHKS